jgi:predicted CDP-diglyceride synthetase/phosphatidate cytidylyltransferase
VKKADGTAVKRQVKKKLENRINGWWLIIIIFSFLST